MKKNNIAKLCALVTILFWGTSFSTVKLVLKHYDWLTFSIIRNVLSALILVAYMYIIKVKLPTKKDIPMLCFSGLAGVSIYTILFNIGLRTLTSATTSVIISMNPILTTIFSSLILKEKINKKSLFFIFLSFIGILILTLWEGVFSLNVGILWIFMAAVCFATYNVTQRKLSQKYSPFECTAYSMIFGSIFLFLLSPKAILEIKNMNLQVGILIFYIVVFVGVVAYVLWSKALSLADKVGEVTNVLFLNPLIATLIGVFFLGEKLSFPIIVGGTLILTGIIGYNKTR